MEQYEKSGPRIDKTVSKEDKDLQQRIDRLEEANRLQRQTIEELHTEIRRLKDKVDRHADHINRQRRG